jgi:hypothetical protein
MVKDKWSEEEVNVLPSGEHDYFERKSGDLLISSDCEVTIAKTLSAFANSGGGHLILGAKDDGTFDGVGLLHKGRTSTRDWLEQNVPNWLDFPLTGFRVHEVDRSPISSIPAQRVVVVIDIPDSEQAPHQSQKDKKYYVRAGGRSVPASHRIIEDIRNRARHPNIELRKVEAIRFGHESGQPPAGMQVNVTIKWTLANVGRIKAIDCCVHTNQNGCGTFTTAPNIVAARSVNDWHGAFWELQHPVYPEMETAFTCVFSFPGTIIRPGQPLGPDNLKVEDVAIAWKIYADSAPVKSGTIMLKSIEFVPGTRRLW